MWNSSIQNLDHYRYHNRIISPHSGLSALFLKFYIYGFGYMIAGEILILFCYWLLEYNGDTNQFIHHIGLNDDTMIIYYRNKKEKNDIPFSSIKNKALHKGVQCGITLIWISNYQEIF